MPQNHLSQTTVFFSSEKNVILEEWKDQYEKEKVVTNQCMKI